MSNSAPQTLKGFRDFLPAEKRARDHVAAQMRLVFERHGFDPIETPTLEYASLLLGKYGDEADKLLYTFEDRGERQVGLRYDQTVPTARVLAQYQHLLPRYFRRYQIQNVFRADKPQKGRYREFTQCDCDVFGSTTPLADAEILSVYFEVFAALGLGGKIVIEINDRRTLLETLTPFSTSSVPVLSIIQSIDKLDKQSLGEVASELMAKGLDEGQAKGALAAIASAQPSASLSEIIEMAVDLGVRRESLVFNPRIARGLDYYTGLIFEGKIPECAGGSVGGGGRYDGLIENLAGFSLPAVGFGIGFDRTVEAVMELGLLETAGTGTQALVIALSSDDQGAALRAAHTLRQAGVRTEVLPTIDKLGKQLKVADQKKIPFVVIIGEAERLANTVVLKNMTAETQTTCSLDDAAREILAHTPTN